MHQSIPAAPIPPRATAGHLHTLSVPGAGHLQIWHGPGVGHLLPRGYPRGFDTLVVSDSKYKHGGFYRKGPAIRRRLDRPSWTGQTSGVFLDFMHFFIAYQGTT